MQLNTTRVALAIVVALATSAFAQTGNGSDTSAPFELDEFTEVLYHFDEGEGNEAHSACGDPKLTLRAMGAALWGEREGFGNTARFDRSDSAILVGPVDDDRVQLRNCDKEWTVEVWAAYTGPGGKNRILPFTGRKESTPHTYAALAATDEEGFFLEHGYRQGWNLCLYPSRFDLGTGNTNPVTIKYGVLPAARFMGYHRGRDPLNDSACGPYHPHAIVDREAGTIRDNKWHHIAWQFRYRDQMHFIIVDGKVYYQRTFPDKIHPANLGVINDAPRCDVPLRFGGHPHSQDPVTHFNETGNLEGEIDEFRISSVMRYPVTDRLSVIHDVIPPLGVNLPFEHAFGVDVPAGGSKGKVTWSLGNPENLPRGLTFTPDGTIKGTPTEVNEDPGSLTVTATDEQGNTDSHGFRLSVVPGRILTESIAPSYQWTQYYAPLETKNLVQPLHWELTDGELPRGVKLDPNTGLISGAAVYTGDSKFTVEVTDKLGAKLQQELTLRVLPEELRLMPKDEHTVALYDWQGKSGRYFPERVHDDKALTLTYTNFGGDRRYHWPGREGRFPQEPGHGEHAYAQVGPDWGAYPDAAANFKSSPVLDLKTCQESWTVEAWVRRGGDNYAFGHPKLTDPGKGGPDRFERGHVCGNYSGGANGIWELYVTEKKSPNGKMVPGAVFRSADHTWLDLDPWNRPEGIVGDPAELGFDDIEWHHIAWQYDHAIDTHELFLDGKLIWKMTNPDGKKLVNDHEHRWQFSIFTRLWKYTKYGGGFNYLGSGNFFGQIGEIRISDVRRYK